MQKHNTIRMDQKNDLLKNQEEVDEYEKGDIILRSEFDRALIDFDNRIAPGIN